MHVMPTSPVHQPHNQLGQTGITMRTRWQSTRGKQRKGQMTETGRRVYTRDGSMAPDDCMLHQQTSFRKISRGSGTPCSPRHMQRVKSY